MCFKGESIPYMHESQTGDMQDMTHIDVCYPLFKAAQTASKKVLLTISKE